MRERRENIRGGRRFRTNKKKVRGGGQQVENKGGDGHLGDHLKESLKKA